MGGKVDGSIIVIRRSTTRGELTEEMLITAGGRNGAVCTARNGHVRVGVCRVATGCMGLTAAKQGLGGGKSGGLCMKMILMNGHFRGSCSGGGTSERFITEWRERIGPPDDTVNSDAEQSLHV